MTDAIKLADNVCRRCERPVAVRGRDVAEDNGGRRQPKCWAYANGVNCVMEPDWDSKYRDMQTALLAAHKRIGELQAVLHHIAQGFAGAQGDAAVVDGHYRGLAGHALASKPTEWE